jgi:hypothetical protein
MKTSLNTQKASDAKPAWKCYAIWWLEALALLFIAVLMSLRHAFQENRPSFSHEPSMEERASEMILMNSAA